MAAEAYAGVLPLAVVFDVDGLLIDTETCDYEAWRELYELHGDALSVGDYCHHAGLYGTWEQRYAELGARWGRSPDELHAWREPRFRELVTGCLAPSAELLALLGKLRRRRIRRGIASSSDRDWVEYLLAGLGLAHEFEAVVTGHDVERRKPESDVYLLAAAKLGVPPGCCVALEDSTHGIQAARAAGMPVIAVPNPISRHQDLSLADAAVAHLGEVSIELLRRVGASTPVLSAPAHG